MNVHHCFLLSVEGSMRVVSLWSASLSDTILKTDYTLAFWWNLMKLCYVRRDNSKQDRQCCTCNATLRRSGVTIVAVEK